MAEAVLRIFRGTREGGEPLEYRVPVATGMVVLDALQGREVRLLFGGGERPPPPHLQNSHGYSSSGQAHHHLPHESISRD